jgi:hypothetical protein
MLAERRESMVILSLPQKGFTAYSHFGRKLGKYGLLFFFLKGILWLLGPWLIYAFQ